MAHSHSTSAPTGASLRSSTARASRPGSSAPRTELLREPPMRTHIPITRRSGNSGGYTMPKRSTVTSLSERASVPPLIKQLNNGNWLPQREAESLVDELFYQRAVHAYMTMLPALNDIGMRYG